MSNAIITRMWGYADGQELLFTKRVNGLWGATVPPDMEDGQYAVEIHGMDDIGRTCLWTGILYMNQGKHCLRINDKKYTFWLIPQLFSFAATGNDKDITRRNGGITIEMLPFQYKIELRRCRRI